MKMKTLIASSVLAASTVASSVAMAESPWSANIGVASNYMWRGITQTDDQAAISGGVDYANPNGIYVGTWTSNINWVTPSFGKGSYELDLYAGYGFDLGPTSWDIGYIQYLYPQFDDNDFGEVYVNFGWEWLSLGVAYTASACTGCESGDLYYYGGVDLEAAGIGFGAVVGQYDYDPANAEDYMHYDLYVSKSDFTFSFSNTDIDDSDPTFWVSWSKSFEL